ncbi:MAG TPA: SIS domain-containing protein [Streptosporangiaceae bacterium]|nr:SIS domain-containing protein [Streptosporangiaceae bacterium]
MRYIEAVRAQGRNLRACRAGIAGRFSRADLAPWRDEALALAGMGASYNAVLAAVGSYWETGIRASAWLGSELQRQGADRNFGAVIAVTQSGRSAEVVSCLASLPARYPKLVLTDDPRSPAAEGADLTVPLSLLEDSAVRTLGYTGTVAALALVRDMLTGAAGRPDWERVADEVERQVPEAERFAERVLPSIRSIRSFDVVGSGAHLGSAAQGALLLREVSRLAGAPYDSRQYLHGPVEVAEPGTAVIVIGGSREAQLAVSLADAGAAVILITSENVGERKGLFVFGLPRADDHALPVLEILPLQTVALALAEDNGVPVDDFRHHQDDTKVGG